MLEIARYNRYRGRLRNVEGPSTSFEEGKTMENFVAHLKKEWKVYAMGIWMIGVTVFLFNLYGQVQAVRQTALKLSSDVDSIESVLIGTDGNVAEVKKQMGAMTSKVANIHKRVMRR
jgi:hypothetical protein